MQADERSVNLLYPIFATLTSHLYDGNSARRTWLLDYYLATRELDIKGSTPLTELYPKLPEGIKLALAKLLLYTPFTHLGFFGTSPSDEFSNDLSTLVDRLKLDKGNLCALSFSKILSVLEDKPYMQPPQPYSTRIKDSITIQKAEKLIAENSFTAFSVNQKAIALGKITKLLLDLARCSIPDHRISKPDYHSNLFKNAFLTAEISLPVDLLGDIRSSYLTFKNFIPTCTFYSLCYQTTLGVNLVPNAETLGFVLGFRGPPASRYSYIRSFGDKLGTSISPKYNLRYDRVLDIVFHGKNTNEAFTIDPETKKTEAVDIRDLPRRDNPYRQGCLEGEGTVLGRSRGTYIIDHTAVHYDKKLSPTDHKYQFPYEVRYLTPRCRMTRSLKNSSLTRDKYQIRAFDRLVEENEITKPNLHKRPKVRDKRWLPIFDEYLASDFSIPALATILKKDEVYFNKLKTKLKKLSRALNGKELHEIDLCKISYEGLAFQSSIDKPYDVTDIEERHYMILFKKCVDLWVQESKTPILPSPATVVIRKLKKPSGKNRIVCRQPILVSIFESFANRIWQVVFQKINRDIGYAVSNYLPGLAVPLYSMERLSEALNGRDFALCNMDVKSCFDNVNLAHPNFIPCLDRGLEVVRERVGRGAASFLSFVFKDYLHANLVTHGNFKFRRSKTCKDVEIPKVGSLPTGFVLSPAIWLTLALPAIMSTSRRVAEGCLIGFDLCGDDFIALAPIGVSDKDKEVVCKPWFKLADALDLKFHFFKNYKDRRVYYNDKWKWLFENKKSQTTQSAWIDAFPAFSIPLFHAGTLLADKRHVETITALDPETMEGKLYGALSKRVRDKGANFLPQPMVKALSIHPSLEHRFKSVADAKRLGDQGDEGREKEQYITGAASSVMPFFYTGRRTGGRGNAVSKLTGWFLQPPPPRAPAGAGGDHPPIRIL